MAQRQTFMDKRYRGKRSKRLHRQINVGGAMHNHCIALHRRYDRRYTKHLSLYTLHAHLAKVKRLPKYAWGRPLGSQAIQEIARRLDTGYQRFFQHVKERKAGKATRRVGPPTFRKIRKAKSFTLTQAGWKLLGGNRWQIGTTIYKFAKSREPLGTIKTVTIKRDALGDLFVYFSCLVDVQPMDRVMTGHSAGFACGLTTYLTGSDGTESHAPQPFTQSLQAIATANRKVAHKVQGSCNRHQARRHLARVHRRVAHVRQAFHWDLAHELCAQYDIIRLETLNLQGMQALWGRTVSDLGFATFVETLHHVASKTGVLVQHIDRWFPSTTLCSACQNVNEPITLRDRVWTCTFCGVTHQRDHNAAINIDQEGASSCGGHPVSLAPASVDG